MNSYVLCQMDMLPVTLGDP